MGSGRSGSTLLGIILGNHPDVFNSGEINNVKGFTENRFSCSCGQEIDSCTYWPRVIKKWGMLNTGEKPDQTMNKTHKIENFKSPMAWLRILTSYFIKSSYFQDYINSQYNFYRAIGEESGKSIIVDISKNPLRAYVLNKHPKIDVKIIHLVRDGRGVAWSRNKYVNPNVVQKSIRRTAFFWSIVNKQGDFVRRKVKNSCLILYENLVKNPEVTLREIADAVEIEADPLIDGLQSNLAQEETHIMAGNKLRREKSIKLKLDEEWRQKLDSKKQKTFVRLAGRGLRKYGYL